MRQAPRIGLVSIAAVLTLLLLLPLAGLILRALTDGDVVTQLTTGKTWEHGLFY